MPFTCFICIEDVFWLHIRSAGHWTGKLYKYFQNYEPMGNNNDAFTLDMETDANGGGVKFQGKCKLLFSDIILGPDHIRSLSNLVLGI